MPLLLATAVLSVLFLLFGAILAWLFERPRSNVARGRCVVLWMSITFLEKMFVLMLVCGVVPYGATKGVRGTVSSRNVASESVFSPCLPTSGDTSNGLFPTNLPPVTNLCFSGIDMTPTSVCLGVSWPSATLFTNDCLDLFGNSRLLTNEWIQVGHLDVRNCPSNVVVTLSRSLLVSNSLEQTAFFRIASQDDADGDGLTDKVEEWMTGTNPMNADTDGDGMPDGWEVNEGFDPRIFGEELDSDGDGLPDRLENQLGTNALQADTDGDGQDDGDEYYAGTNPLLSDTDGDGMSDGEEFNLGTDPLLSETYTTYNNDSNEVMRAAVGLGATRGGVVGEDVFDEPQGNTQTGGPDYEMEGQYSVEVSYLGAYTGTFGILGVYPPSGTTTREPTPTGSWYSENGPSYLNAFSLTASGASFRPLKTGFYSFQAHADDTVSVTIGTNLQFSADFYTCNPGLETNALLVAGRSYPVRIDAASIGGPAELSFPVWGAFTPISKPQLAVKTSASVVIFENGYRNVPDKETCPTRSTEVVLRIGVRGGGLGGQLLIETLNGNRLVLKNGDDCRTGCYDIDAGTTNYWEGVFTAQTASLTTNDVRIIATFTENETGLVTSTTNSLTVVRVELTAVKRAPQEADSHRHVFGVCEDVAYTHYPQQADVSWLFSPTGTTYGIVCDDGAQFTCPHAVLSNDCVEVQAQISSHDVEFSTSFKVFVPNVIARNPRANVYTNDVSPVMFEAGHLLLYLEKYAAPLFLSFKDLEMREAPDESQICQHGGYFDDKVLGGEWSHSASCGAGIWHVVKNDGCFCEDKAGRRIRYEKPWQNGYKVWPIPMEYGYAQSAIGVILPNPATHQRFELTEQGTFTIRKFGFWARRYRFGYISVNGKWAW